MYAVGRFLTIDNLHQKLLNRTQIANNQTIIKNLSQERLWRNNFCHRLGELLAVSYWPLAIFVLPYQIQKVFLKKFFFANSQQLTAKYLTNYVETTDN